MHSHFTSLGNKMEKDVAGSHAFTQKHYIVGGWEWENVDLSLLDVGTVKLSGGYENGVFDLSAMASLWTPSITVTMWDVDITISAHVGSIGGKYIMGNNKFDIAGAGGYGVGISASW